MSEAEIEKKLEEYGKAIRELGEAVNRLAAVVQNLVERPMPDENITWCGPPRGLDGEVANDATRHERHG